MYLSRRTYIGGHYEHRNVQGPKVDIIIGEKEPKTYSFDLSKIEAIEEQVCYWRKANHIHKWFVDNCQEGVDECQKTTVSTGQLKELLETCRKVIEVAKLEPGKIHVSTSIENGKHVKNYKEGQVISNAEEVAEILPTQGGFFFGSTGYDEWYLADIERTIKVLESLDLDNNDYEVDYAYQSSW